jgi:hypothetical protein
MVNKIFQAKLEAWTAGVGVEVNNVAKALQLLRLAVRRQTHHFVLITEFQKTQILGHRAIKNSQRMRERDGASNLHMTAAASAPHGAGKIAEAVG